MAQKVIIYNSKKTKYLEALELLVDIEYIEQKSSFLGGLFKKKDIPIVDLYFYGGKLEKYNLELLQNAKFIIVNSNKQKEFLKKKLLSLKFKNIEILYPSIGVDIIHSKKIKDEFKELYKIKQDEQIIFFRANNLEKMALNNSCK